MADKEAPPRPTASGADRFSALPDGVRELVLSYLPAHEAVRTTVLARSWLNLWIRSPALRITGWGSVAKFTQFMEELMRLHLSTPVSRRHAKGDPCAAPAPLDSWHLDFGRSDFDDEANLVEDMAADVTLMNRWIQSAVSCGVRMLRFRFSRNRGNPIDLPDLSLVISEHLTKIELSGVAIFPNLNLSGCPALQDLKMEGCFLCSNEMQAPYLKHLTMADCVFPLVTRTAIRLPSLISLKFIQCSGWTPFLGSMPSLETAIVIIDSFNCDDRCSLPSINGCGGETCIGCLNYGVDIDHANGLLLNGLSEATDLELSAYPDVTVFIRDLKNAHAFRKLKALVLTDWFVASDFSALIWFLHHSPVLEKLTLQISKVHKIPKSTEGRCKLPEQSFASSNLKIVEIKCHCVDKTVIEVLKILTTFGVPLERINIQWPSTGSDYVNFRCTSLSSK